MINIKKTIFLFLILFFQNQVYASINLELTRGVDNAIPIAISSFGEVSKVIVNDLHNSGLFKKVDVNKFPHSLSEVDLDVFKENQVDYLVIGNIKSQGLNNYNVEYKLIDIYRNNKQDAVVTEGTYNILKKDLRRLSHKISDDIYEKIIGEKGIFSTKIAYVLEKRKTNRISKYSLMIADSDGCNPKPILISNEPIMSPSWAPSGKEIVYVSFENKRASIYISDIETGTRELISQFEGVNGAPAFSHDGKKLALVLTKTGSPNIYIMDLQNKDLKQITHGWYIDTEPSWSCDDKSIIFTSDRGGSPQIYQIDLISHKINRVTYSGNYNAKASFTPYGKSIIMLNKTKKDFNIAKQDLESGIVTILTKSHSNQSPSISPNGRMIIYTSQERTYDVLNIVSIDGKVKLHIPESDGSIREPVWASS